MEMKHNDDVSMSKVKLFWVSVSSWRCLHMFMELRVITIICSIFFIKSHRWVCMESDNNTVSCPFVLFASWDPLLNAGHQRIFNNNKFIIFSIKNKSLDCRVSIVFILK